MNLKPNKRGGRDITGDTPYGKFAIVFTRAADNQRMRIVDLHGNEVGEAYILFREPIPLDTSPEQEQARAKSGGCCGQASE